MIEALGHQLKAYNYSSEKDRMFVPFARLLRMWDERPEDFDEYEVHTLHWVFKWMTTGMLDQPHIPLASIEKWLGEMEHRYRLAGHSERAVRGAEFSVAAHVGDLARAERAYAAWLAADRDSMADCHACELHSQGWWQAERGADAEAIDLWRPVLEGEFTCAHEPHTVLASSLGPLLRLGRLDEARAHHLRGFRLVRPMESMRGAYADHVEFCALTGNEARGLELLAERPAYFTDSGQPRSQMDFLAAVTLLMGGSPAWEWAPSRCPDRPGATGPPANSPSTRARRPFPVRALRPAQRHVVRRRRRPCAHGPGSPGGPASAGRAGGEGIPAPRRAPVESMVTATSMDSPDQQTDAPGDLPALLADARRMSDALLPHAMEAWAAVWRAAEDVELPAADRAEIVDHRAMEGGPEGIALFERAAELYAEAGDPGEALAARARAAYARALEGDVDAALTAVSEPYEEVLALYSDEGTGVRQAAAVLMGRARILMRQVEETGTDQSLAAAENAVRELLAFVDGHAGDDVRLASRGAEAQAMLGELATRTGDLARAAELFARSTEAFVAAGLPWFAVEYEARLAGLAHHLGDVAGAERALRGALEHGGAYLEAAGQAQLNLQLAEILGARDEVTEAADRALDAAHWADEAGEGPTLGAWARHLLGGFLLRQGRWAEAAEVLESALPDLGTETHGDGAVVQTLWWLGDCLGELGEHRESAERRLKAAEIARHWPEQQDHATLAHLAAESLGLAGLPAEADQAYERAGDLWDSLGNVHGLVRALRARAWLALRTEAGLDGARRRMGDAVRECAQALSEAEDLESREQLGAELAHTHRQFGDLLARSAAEDAEDGAIEAAFEAALAQMTKAIAVFSSLGEEGLHGRTGAELAAGWLEADLSRPSEAAARARGVLIAYEAFDDSDEEAGARRAEAEQMLQLMEEQEA